MIPEHFSVSIAAICTVSVLFVIILIWHLCSDFGCYNSHRRIEHRRQPYQKTVFNLQVAERIFVCVHPSVAATPGTSHLAEPDQNIGAPSFAFRQQGLSSIEEDPDSIETYGP